MIFPKKPHFKIATCRSIFAKRIVFVPVMGIISVVILLTYVQNGYYTPNIDYITIVPRKQWRNNNESDTWLTLGDPKRNHKVYSAFFDSRPEVAGWHPVPEKGQLYGSIRMFAVLRTKLSSPLSCQFVNATGHTVGSVAAQASPIKENFGLFFSAYTIMCPLVKEIFDPIVDVPKFVALCDDKDPMTRINPVLIPIRYSNASLHRQEPSRTLAICGGPIHNNYGEALRIVEYVHLAQLMGVEKIYFYYMDANPAVNAVLEYFQNTDIVQVLTWNLDGYVFEKDLRYAGIFAALNECVYRATFVDDFKFVAIVDLDEVLVSFKYPNLVDYIKSIDKDGVDSIVFRGVFFHKNDEDPAFQPPNGVTNHFLYTQSRKTRTRKPFPNHNRSKYVVKARAVVEVGNHFVWKQINQNREIAVDPKDGLLFHYRDECMGSTCNAEKQSETTMLRYAPDLWKLVDETCQTIFKDGKCPIEK